MIQPYLSGAEEKALVYVAASTPTPCARVPLPAARLASPSSTSTRSAAGEASGEERETAEAAIACALTRRCTPASTCSAAGCSS